MHESATSFYRDGGYGAKHSQWHSEDGAGKALDIWHGIADVAGTAGQRKLRVCEVGCGSGSILSGLHDLAKEKMLNAELELIGLDVSQYAIDLGRSLFPAIDLRVQDFLSLDEQFDIILFCDVLEHLENPFEFMRHAQRLSPAMVVRQPLQGDFGLFRTGGHKKTIDDLGHIQFFSSKSFIAMADFVGWRESSVQLVAPWELYTAKSGASRLKKAFTKANREIMSFVISGFYLTGSFVRT